MTWIAGPRRGDLCARGVNVNSELRHGRGSFARPGAPAKFSDTGDDLDRVGDHGDLPMAIIGRDIVDVTGYAGSERTASDRR